MVVEYHDSVWKYDENGMLLVMKTKDGKCERYERNGKLHREDGPALVFEKYEAWYNNGVLMQEKRK